MKKRQERLQGIIGDVLRRVPLKSEVRELRIPKELVGSLISNIDKSRTGLLQGLHGEINKVLAKVDVQGLLDELVKKYRIRIQAEIILEPKTKRGKKGKRE